MCVTFWWNALVNLINWMYFIILCICHLESISHWDIYYLEICNFTKALHVMGPQEIVTISSWTNKRGESKYYLLILWNYSRALKEPSKGWQGIQGIFILLFENN